MNSKLRFNDLHLLVCTLTLPIVLAVLGCAPAKNSPDRGGIDLKFDSIKDRETSSDVVLILENGLNRQISVMGERELPSAIRMSQPEANIWCSPLHDSSTIYEAGVRPFGVGGSKMFFDIESSEKVKLLIGALPMEKFKGGHCRADLALKDGVIVGEIEFQP